MLDEFFNTTGSPKSKPLSCCDLTAEAVLVLLAGMDTTANALIIGTWSVLQDPKLHSALVEELSVVMPILGMSASVESLASGA